MPNCVIYQPAGMGDIFFLQKMVKHYESRGYTVTMPVLSHLVWLKDYLNAGIVDIQDEFPMKHRAGEHGVITEGDDIYISTHTADLTHNDGRIMTSKYSMVGLDSSDWANFFSFYRDYGMEQRLYDVLGFEEDSRYIVSSSFCGTPPGHSDFGNIPINNPDNLPVVRMGLLDGFNLFDWCKVLENAERIFIVNTSTNYILEKLELKAKEYVIYSKNPNNHYQVETLFKNQDALICLG